MAGGSVFFGGNFTQADSVPRTFLAGFDTTSNGLTSFDPGVNSTVLALATSGDHGLRVRRVRRRERSLAPSFAMFGLDVPANTARPGITGSVLEGGTLTCSQGTWDNSPTSFAFQWLRDGTPVAGETAATHTVAGADIGRILQCQVTARNDTAGARSRRASRSGSRRRAQNGDPRHAPPEGPADRPGRPDQAGR